MRASSARWVGALLSLGFVSTTLAQHGAPAAPQSMPVHDVATQGPPPKIVLSDTEFNFGEVWSGDKVEKEITVENKGQAALNFSVRSSCGCTVAQLSVATRLTGEEYQYQLAPGQSDKIRIAQIGCNRALRVVALLVHPDRAVHSIVDHKGDHARAILNRSRQFLPGHEEVAISRYADNRSVGVTELRRNSSGEPITH